MATEADCSYNSATVGRSPVKLPNAESAVVDRRKVLEYLLNAAHPDNGGKARFFEGLGFSGNDPSPPVAALHGVATSGEASNEWNRRTARSIL